MFSIKNGFALTLVLVAPSLFGKEPLKAWREYINIYNNTIYSVNVEVKFANSTTKNSRTIAPAKEENIVIPTGGGGASAYTSGGSSKERRLETIQATVPDQHEPLWEGGKFGTKIVGSKKILSGKSAVFTPASHFGDPDGRQNSETFVISASRNPGFINGIRQVEGLAIYRFIQ